MREVAFVSGLSNWSSLVIPYCPMQPSCNVCATSLATASTSRGNARSAAAGQSLHALSPAPLPHPRPAAHPHRAAHLTTVIQQRDYRVGIDSSAANHLDSFGQRWPEITHWLTPHTGIHHLAKSRCRRTGNPCLIATGSGAMILAMMQPAHLRRQPRRRRRRARPAWRRPWPS